MTIIDEKITLNNGRTISTHRRPTPVPEPPPPVPTLVRTARRVAVSATGGIAVVSFVLSFAGLADLARRSGIPGLLAWLWPLAVDGTIVQATVAIVALAAYPAQARNRRFFWAVLVASAAVSVGGNVLHALIVGPVPPGLSAVIATVAPLSLLATTHGLAVMTRFDPEERG